VWLTASNDRYQCVGCGGWFGAPGLLERGLRFDAPECVRSFFTCHECGRDADPLKGAIRVESTLHPSGETPERATFCRTCWTEIAEEYGALPADPPWRAV